MAKGKQFPEVFFPVGKNSNELSLYHYGKHGCLPGNSYGPNKRDYYLLHFVASGKGVYKVGGKTFHLQKNEGFLIRPNEETFYQADVGEPWEYYFVAFHGTIAEKMVNAVDWIDGYVIRPQNYQSIRSIMRAIYSVKKPDLWGEYMALGNLYMLWANLIKESERNKETELPSAQEDLLNKAIDYIKKNYERGIRVSDIANAINVHRVSLYRLFKECLNVSVEKYLQNYRMDKAVSLLQNTDLSVTEICARVGMFDYPHFCRQFKRHFGFTPSEYRKQFVSKSSK
jgi:AraC-like DNA-binding protein